MTLNDYPGSECSMSEVYKISKDEVHAHYEEFSKYDVSFWHFPMMNDVVRNAAFEKALARAIRGGAKTVLDIGSGSGLLAMMAARLGAERVYTVEENPKIAKKALEIIKLNGFSDRITLINKASTHITVGKELPEPADVLVAEVFDDGLLGERALETIAHAKDKLLKVGAHLIPEKARVFALALESQEIYENFRVEKASGFDLGPFNSFGPDGFIGHHLDKMNYRPLTSVIPVFDFDFKQIMFNSTNPIRVEVLANGTCHAIAYWFELGLDSETTVSTSPGLKRLSCWRQAVQVLDRGLQVKEGETLSVTANHNAESIWFSDCKSE